MDFALYQFDKPDNCCTLVLSGKMLINAGRSGFRSEAGPWTVLAADALTKDDGNQYIADFSQSNACFTACVLSVCAKCVLSVCARARACVCVGEICLEYLHTFC